MRACRSGGGLVRLRIDDVAEVHRSLDRSSRRKSLSPSKFVFHVSLCVPVDIGALIGDSALVGWALETAVSVGGQRSVVAQNVRMVQDL